MSTFVRSMVIMCLASSGLGTACSKSEVAPTEAARKAAAPKPRAVAPTTPAPAPSRAALRIAYSNWPGWVAWDIAIKKGFFKEAGVEVDFKWFEYVPSMDAYATGKVDAVSMTNGDALV